MTIRLSVAGGPTLDVSRYLYRDGPRPADKEGFPTPVERARIDLATGLDVPCPPESVVLLTSRQ